MRFSLPLIALCLWGCASISPQINTFADLKAESWRLGMSYARSQLSSHPQQNVIPSDAEARWFYKLPLCERAVYIAYVFTVTPPEAFDGERSESMRILLTQRKEWSPFAPSDSSYTKALFAHLSEYTQKQLHDFAVYVGGNTGYFNRNLSMWRQIIQRDYKNG
jgi:hypothetical protein